MTTKQMAYMISRPDSKNYIFLLEIRSTFIQVPICNRFCLPHYCRYRPAGAINNTRQNRLLCFYQNTNDDIPNYIEDSSNANPNRTDQRQYRTYPGILSEAWKNTDNQSDSYEMNEKKKIPLTSIQTIDRQIRTCA